MLQILRCVRTCQDPLNIDWTQEYGPDHSKRPAHRTVIPLFLEKKEHFQGCSEADSMNAIAPGNLFSYSSTAAAGSSMLNNSTSTKVFMLSASEHPRKCLLFSKYKGMTA